MSTTPALKVSSTSNLRKRRHSYTRVACDECQRRKTKCTGEQPCKACRDSNSTCLYERTTRFRARRYGSGNATGAQDLGVTAQESPRERTGLHSPRSATAAAAASSPPATRLPGSDYYLHLAEKFLIASKPQKQQGRTRARYEPVASTPVLQQLILYRSTKSPGSLLALVDTERWLGIIAAYDEEVGLQYPFLDLECLRQEIQRINQDSPHSIQKKQVRSPAGGKSDQQRVEDIAMHILAIVSILADPSAIEIANKWIEETYAATIARTQLQSTVDMTDLSLAILASISFFFTDREVLAWRGIGNVLRLLQEHGSRSSGDATPQSRNQDTAQGEKLYWTVYTLDRRWSFGTGLPFAVQDSEIDRHPMWTDDSLSSTYVAHMVTYCRIASEVRKWLLESSASSIAAFDATRDILDFRVVQWRRNLPRKLQFGGVEDKFEPAKENRGEYRIRLTLHLRANQMRIIIHKKSTVRPGSIGFHPSTVNIVTEVARDTIRILVQMAQETDIYNAQHKTFNYFLETALASLLLVLGCVDDDVDRASCMKDADDAMELIQRLSTRSPISRRLLERLHSIQEAMNHFRDRSLGQSSHYTRLLLEGSGVSHTDHSSSDIDSATAFAQNQTRVPSSRQEPATSSSEQVFVNRPAPGPAHGGREVQQQVSQHLGDANSAFTASIDPYHRLTPDTVAGHTPYPQMYAGASDTSPHTGLDLGPSNMIEYSANDFPFLSFPELREFMNESGSSFSF